jgi:hypothetical protein
VARLGEVVTLNAFRDERYEIVVHGIERLEPEPSLGLETQYLLIDWSVRNASERPVQWLSGNGLPTILASDGTRLNAEPTFDGIPLRVADLGADQSACAVPRGGGPAYLGNPLVTGGWSMPPGAVYRSYTAFRQTPGLEREDLRFEVSFAIDQTFGGPRTSAIFDLASPPSPNRLEWSGDGTNPQSSAQVTNLTFSNAQSGEVTPGGASNPSDFSNSCGFSRAITMTVRNDSATTQSISTGNFQLVDVDGRFYAPRESTFVDVAPQSEAEISVVFPALVGRGEPSAIYIGGYLAPGETEPLLVTVRP